MSEQVLHLPPNEAEPEQPTSQPTDYETPAVPANPPKTSSRRGAFIGVGSVVAGAAAFAALAAGTKPVEGKAMPGDGFAPTPDDTTTSAPEVPTSPSETAETPVPTQLNLDAEIPDEQVENLYGLPEDSFDGHWDVTEPSAEPAPENAPVPVRSHKLLTPDFNVIVDVYEDQSLAKAVEAQGGIVEDLPSEGGMNILSIPQLNMVEGSFAVDAVDGRHNYTITVYAADTAPEDRAKFAAEVVKDFTTSPEQ